MSIFNFPYAKIESTLGTSFKYLQPAMGHMAIGAAAGGAAGYMGGNGHTMRDAGIGALGGLAMGKNMHGAFHAAAKAEPGTYKFGAGFSAVKDMAVSDWKDSGQLFGSTGWKV